MATVKAMDKDELYKRTGWFSRDCSALIDNLKDFGLCIVDTDKLNKVNTKNKLREDDLK